MHAFEAAMQMTAEHLSKSSDTWKIDRSVISKLEKELNKLENSDTLDEETKKVQQKDKKIIIKLMKCLVDYAANI